MINSTNSIYPFIHRRPIIDQKIPFTASRSKVDMCHRYRSLERLFPGLRYNQPVVQKDRYSDMDRLAGKIEKPA